VTQPFISCWPRASHFVFHQKLELCEVTVELMGLLRRTFWYKQYGIKSGIRNGNQFAWTSRIKKSHKLTGYISLCYEGRRIRFPFNMADFAPGDQVCNYLFNSPSYSWPQLLFFCARLTPRPQISLGFALRTRLTRQLPAILGTETHVYGEVIVFWKLRLRDGSMWTEGQTVERKLSFQIKWCSVGVALV